MLFTIFRQEKVIIRKIITLQCHHNDHDGVSNHRCLNCLLNRLFRRRSKKLISTSLAFVSGIHRWPVDSPHTGPVTRKIFQFDDVIMMFNSAAWAFYQIRKIAGCTCAGNTGNVFPVTDFKGNRQLATPACIAARASCTCRDACRDG